MSLHMWVMRLELAAAFIWMLAAHAYFTPRDE